MPFLLADDDGAIFTGRIERIDGQIRASYLVVLEIGPETQIQRDVRMFEREELAIGWLHKEADLRHFKKFELDLR